VCHRRHRFLATTPGTTSAVKSARSYLASDWPEVSTHPLPQALRPELLSGPRCGARSVLFAPAVELVAKPDLSGPRNCVHRVCARLSQEILNHTRCITSPLLHVVGQLARFYFSRLSSAFYPGGFYSFI